MVEKENLKARYANLIAEYAETLPSKAVELTNLIASGEESGWPSAAREELSTAIHRIAGSSGSYGFAKLSAVARSLDRELHQWAHSPDARWSNDLAKKVDAVIKAIQDSA